jgi:hypothetical protein
MKAWILLRATASCRRVPFQSGSDRGKCNPIGVDVHPQCRPPQLFSPGKAATDYTDSHGVLLSEIRAAKGHVVPGTGIVQSQQNGRVEISEIRVIRGGFYFFVGLLRSSGLNSYRPPVFSCNRVIGQLDQMLGGRAFRGMQAAVDPDNRLAFSSHLFGFAGSDAASQSQSRGNFLVAVESPDILL